MHFLLQLLKYIKNNYSLNIKKYSIGVLGVPSKNFLILGDIGNKLQLKLSMA